MPTEAQGGGIIKSFLDGFKPTAQRARERNKRRGKDDSKRAPAPNKQAAREFKKGFFRR